MKYTLLLIGFLSFNVFAGENKWPVTLAEAVSNILISMNKESKEKIRTTTKEDLIQYHHGWGTGPCQINFVN